MLGYKIKFIRTLIKNMSINKLSELTGISLGYLSDLENDKFTNPTLDKLHKIAAALNVPIEDFFKTIEVGYNIKRIRENRNMSIDELATEICIPSSMLMDIENSKCTASMGILKDVIKALNIKANMLLEEVIKDEIAYIDEIPGFEYDEEYQTFNKGDVIEGLGEGYKVILDQEQFEFVRLYDQYIKNDEELKKLIESVIKIKNPDVKIGIEKEFKGKKIKLTSKKFGKRGENKDE